MEKKHIFFCLFLFGLSQVCLQGKVEIGSIEDQLLEKIDKTKKQLEEATELDLQNKDLTTDELEVILNFLDPEKLVELDISHNNIVKLPENIGEFYNLKKLDASNNNLIPFPTYVFNCTNLEQLDLKANKLIRVPRKISELKNLLLLNVSNNRIKSLPDSINDLRQLRNLYVESNFLRELPDRLPILLRYIKASENRLEVLPDEIGACDQLEFLEIAKNQLKKIPSSVSNLRKLRFLDLRENKNKKLFELPSLLDRKTLKIFGDYEFVDVVKTDRQVRRKPFPITPKKRRERKRELRRRKKRKDREHFLKLFREGRTVEVY